MSEAFAEKRKKEITDNPILVYGKGTKLMPMCGFTANVVGMLQELGQPFSVINVLDDEELRQGLKEFSGWPTFPQVYIGGEFIGGHDIVVEMFQNGELKTTVSKVAAGGE